jgi:NADPH-dependent 2,4-dienoyl-CoA reductase/sulfur reductase-like enzyme
MPSAINNSSSTLEPQNDDPDSTTYRQDLHSTADDPFEQHDVVVVGAGPSGLFCALKMAQKGIDVLVIESGPAISESPRAIACVMNPL